MDNSGINEVHWKDKSGWKGTRYSKSDGCARAERKRGKHREENFQATVKCQERNEKREEAV